MLYVSICALSAVQTVLNSDLQGRKGELYCTVDKMGQFCNRPQPETVVSLSVVVGVLSDHLRPFVVYIRFFCLQILPIIKPIFFSSGAAARRGPWPHHSRGF
jgi:hypothetical protein